MLYVACGNVVTVYGLFTIPHPITNCEGGAQVCVLFSGTRLTPDQVPLEETDVVVRTRLNRGSVPRAADGTAASHVGRRGLSFPSACASHALTPSRIQIKDVVTMARMVPVGIDFCASLRSPDRFEPAIMPVETDDLTCY